MCLENKASERMTSADVQAYIDAQGLDATLVHDIGHTPTVSDAARALGVHTDQIVKTLLFLLKLDTDDGSELTPLLVISNGTNRVDKKAIAQKYNIGKKRVRLASPDIVLNVLGYPAGGVPPFAHKNDVAVVLDQSVIDVRERFDGVIYAGGGDDATMMKLTVDELISVTKAEIVPVSAAD